MNAEQIQKLIELLPTLIMYFVPGYLILWINSFMLSQKLEKDKHLLLKSIVVSYIILTIENYFFGRVITIPTIIFALIFGLLLSRVILSKCFSKVLSWMGINKSFYSNFWNDVIDMENGLWVIVYLPNEQLIYKGQLRRFEEKDNTEHTFLILSNYTLLNYSGEEIISYAENKQYRVIINTKDISRIELFYHQDSKMIN